MESSRKEEPHDCTRFDDQLGKTILKTEDKLKE